jgi:D-alanine-D-alanine ligase
MNLKTNVAVLYGGQSGEHEVSLRSAGAVMENLDDTKYHITPVYISKDGKWDIAVEDLRRFDVVFPVLHGPNGEDGTVQGLLRLMGVPFVGADVVGSAVGMDKVIFKDVLRAHNLPVPDYVVVRKGEWHKRRQDIIDNAVAILGLPIFTKPANMGSSVGISKCKTIEELIHGVESALKWDRKILLEKAVQQARELEVSVLGNEEMIASVVGEIIPSREFYDYEAKYIDKGENESKLLIPAPIPEPLSVLIRETAIETAQISDVQGMARVDFLLDGTNGEIYINEINTIPGFTEISMYPKLFIAAGYTYSGLLDRLVQLALEPK